MANVVVRVAQSDVDYQKSLLVRRRVFIEEQGVPESIEVDEFEKGSTHFLAESNGEPVGAGRLRIKKSYAKFERIATLRAQRGRGVGRLLMEFMQSYAAKHLSQYLPAMHAQMSAISFYEKLGWIAIGEEFFEAGMAHKILIYPPQDPALIRDLKVWKDPGLHSDILEYLRGLLS